MTDYYYPVLSDETSLPLYVLGIGARDREFHFVREDVKTINGFFHGNRYGMCHTPCL